LHGVSDAQPCQFRNWIAVLAFNRLVATGGYVGKGGDAPVTRESKREGRSMKTRPAGVIPPMTTPFRKDGEVDFKLVAPQVD
jgi:hypothetical protein